MMGKTIKKELATKAGREASCSATRSKPMRNPEIIECYRKRSIIRILQANNCNPNNPDAFAKQCTKVPFETIKSEWAKTVNNSKYQFFFNMFVFMFIRIHRDGKQPLPKSCAK